MQNLMHSSGFSTKEHRLCHAAPAHEGGPVLEGLRRANRAITEFIQDKITGILDPQSISAQRMSDERQWVDAFRRKEVFTGPQRAVSSLKDPYGPAEWLQTQNPDQRRVEFVKFAQAMVPPEAVRNLAAKPGMARIVAILQATPETFLAPGSLTDPEVKLLQDIVGRLIGIDVSGAGIDKDVAEAAFAQLYPNDPAKIGHLYADYEQAITTLRDKDLRPTQSELSNPDYLIQHLPESVFKGWLRNTDPNEVRRRLADLSLLAVEHEKKKELVELKAKHQLKEIDRSVADEAEKELAKASDHLANLDPSQKAILGTLAVISVVRILKSKSKWPKRFLYGLAGYYTYLTLIEGDPHAFGTMLNQAQTGAKTVKNFVKSGLEKTGIKGKEETSLDRLQTMLKFLDEKAFIDMQKQDTTAVGFAALAQANISYIASSFHYSANPLEPFGGILIAAPSDPLYKQMDKIIVDNHMDRQQVHQFLYKNNPAVGQGLSVFFYLMGAKDPRHVEMAKKIEKARRDNGPYASYDSIRNTALRQAYQQIVVTGINAADKPPYAGKRFVDIADLLMEHFREEKLPPIDTSERIDNVRTLPTKTEEYKLYALRKAPIEADMDKERSKSIDRLEADCKQFLLNCRDKHKFINDKALTELTKKFDVILKSGKPLRDIAQDVEKLKYALMVVAYYKDALPLGEREMPLVFAGAEDERGFVAWLGEVANFFNRNILTLSSHFHYVEDMESVEAFLKSDRLITLGAPRSLNKEGLPLLVSECNRYSELFRQMKFHDKGSPSTHILNNDISTAETSADKLKAQFTKPRGPFNNEGDARQALITVLSQGNRDHFNERIKRMEKYFAQRCANAVVLGLLTNHQAKGDHKLELEPDRRIITPTEELNIADEWKAMFEEIAGELHNPSDGFWNRMEFVEQLQTIRLPIDVNDTKKKQKEALDHAVSLGRLYVQINPALRVGVALAAGAGMAGIAAPPTFDTAPMRAQVTETAQKFIERWDTALQIAQNRNQANPQPNPLVTDVDVKREFKKEPGFSDLESLLATMDLMGIDMVPPPGGGAPVSLRVQVEAIVQFH